MKHLLSIAACVALLGVAPDVPPTTGVVSTTDVDLAYETYGSATSAVPLIAVNGGPGLSHAYMLQNDVWQRIAHDRKVIFYDQRGTGKSTRVRAHAPQTMAAQVADLDAVRAKVGAEKVDLVGDSFGGFVVIAYAAAHPEHVHKLVVSDGIDSWGKIVHLLPQVFPEITAEDAAMMKKLGNTDAAAQASLVNHFRMIFYSEEKRDAYLAGMKDLGYTPKVGNAVYNATSTLDLSGKLKAFRFPTLIITGRFDMNVAPLTAYRMAKAIPGAQFVAFEKSGHLPSYEEPDKYVSVLTAFLDK